MGNVSGRRDGEGTSANPIGGTSMEFALRRRSHRSDPSFRSSPPGLWELRSNLLNVPMSTDSAFVHSEKRMPLMITWSYGGEKVAITGSWDNWELIEPMQRSGEDFIIVKLLHPGVYHFRFIVDDHLRYAPDLPCDFSDPGGAYNIMDVKEDAAETRESISDFELPPSPVATYSNNLLIDAGFSKPPPDLPPQLHRTLINETYHESLPCPQLPVLNHLYVKEWDSGQAIALGTTHRFHEKYVTVILYKPSRSHG